MLRRGKGKLTDKGKIKLIDEPDDAIIDDLGNYEWEEAEYGVGSGGGGGVAEYVGEADSEDSDFVMGSDDGFSDLDDALFEKNIDKEVEWSGISKEDEEKSEADILYGICGLLFCLVSCNVIMI
ncbi:hypothetical protein OROMI_030949 [Orobanche minor]